MGACNFGGMSLLDCQNCLLIVGVALVLALVAERLVELLVERRWNQDLKLGVLLKVVCHILVKLKAERITICDKQESIRNGFLEHLKELLHFHGAVNNLWHGLAKIAVDLFNTVVVGLVHLLDEHVPGALFSM